VTSPNPESSPTNAAGEFISEVLTGLSDVLPAHGSSVPATPAPSPANTVVPSANTTPAPANLPTVTTSMLNPDTLKEIQAAALSTAEKQIQSTAPQLLKELETYAVSYTSAVLAGQHPTPIPRIEAPNAQGNLTQIDAKNRGIRTLLGGFSIDLFYALIAGIGTLSGVNFFNKAGLATFGVLVTKTIIQTIISYVARLKITPDYQK